MLIELATCVVTAYVLANHKEDADTKMLIQKMVIIALIQVMICVVWIFTNRKSDLNAQGWRKVFVYTRACLVLFMWVGFLAIFAITFAHRETVSKSRFKGTIWLCCWLSLMLAVMVVLEIGAITAVNAKILGYFSSF
jgi:nucleoside recognition membrane protein YjiH